MTTSTEADPKLFLTLKEIASLAGVTSSAVSNWRRRHEDFPAAVRESSRGELFDRSAIVTWLRKRGVEVRDLELSVSDHVWRALDALRDACRPQEAALFLLQSLFVHHVLGRSQAEGKRWQSQLEQIREFSGELLPSWQRLLDHLAEEDLQSARALALPEDAAEEVLNAALHEASALVECCDVGEVARALVDVWTERGGRAGAETATPKSVAELLVGFLEPIEGVVYDPAFGVGRVLGEAWGRREDDSVQLVGQDVNEWAWRVGFLHLALVGADATADTGDTLLDDRFRGLRADRIALVPPFKLSVPKSLSSSDPRWVHGIPKQEAEWLWVQHIVHHLEGAGAGALVMPRGALMGRKNEGIRASVLKSGVIEAVIGLPSGLLEDSGIPIYVLLLSKAHREQADQVLFVDASGLGSGGRGRRMELSPEDIERIVGTVHGWRAGDVSEQPRFSGVATIEEVVEANAELLPARFIRYLIPGATVHGTDVSEDLRSAEARLKNWIDEPDRSVERVLSATTRTFVREPTKSWPLVRLGDLLSESPRRGRKQEAPTGTPAIPFVDAQDVLQAGGKLTQTSKEAGQPTRAAPTVREGDLLLIAHYREGLGNSDTCSLVAIEGEAAFSEHLLRMRPDPEEVLPEFLRLVLSAPQTAQALNALATGGAVTALRPELVEELRVPVPSRADQRMLVEWWSDVEEAKARLEELVAICGAVSDSLQDGLAGGVIEVDGEAGLRGASEREER